MKRMVSGLVLSLMASVAGSLPAAAQSSPPVKGMASTVGLYVYPKNSQSASQQLTDESQCYTNAKTQTGYDPNATTTAGAPKKDDTKTKDDHDMAKGAARGAIISGGSRKSVRTSRRLSRLKNRRTPPRQQRLRNRSIISNGRCQRAWTLAAIQ
jgi:hypothetical protein